MAARAMDFRVGDLVRLVGLKREDFNHHVGQVVTLPAANGRIGVSLHGAVWEDPEKPVSQYDPFSLDPQNLRRVMPPSTERTGRMCVLDSMGPTGIKRLLGESGWGLPDNVVELVVSQLQILSVQSDEVRVTNCSSGRDDFDISVVLNEHEDEWWISEPGSCPGGVGQEYLDFSFDAVRRISFVAMKIPPLPHGPLSVRDFHLLAGGSSEDPESWERASPVPLQTLDRADLQEFALVPPVEAQTIRLVCTRNADAASAEKEAEIPRRRRYLGSTGCIGLFQVSFA